jgi:large subunit ribosomal protein L15
MILNEVNRGIHKHKLRKRLGRGVGSGQGKTAGRGHKGQKSHAGWSSPPAFQGGQMPLVRRVPKRGFHNKFGIVIAEVNVAGLEAAFAAGDEVGLEQLQQSGLLRGRFEEVKILGHGDLTKKLTVAAHRFSASAKEKIEQVGGQCVVLAGKTPVAVKQKQRKKAQANKS